MNLVKGTNYSITIQNTQNVIFMLSPGIDGFAGTNVS
jgi:hypothetical protein